MPGVTDSSRLLVDGAEVDYSGLPEPHQRETMRRYIEAGVQPGSAFLAILTNDLGAVTRVDQDTLLQLPLIYRWMVNHAPTLSWGSTARVSTWMAQRRAENHTGRL